MAVSHSCEGLAYTYNQPTIFIEYASDIGRLASEKGIFNIFVSNGFDTPETVGFMKDFVDCVTVDFKGSGETGFVRRYIGIPNADPIFESLLETKNRTNIHIEITDLIVPQVGDSLDAATRLSKWVYDNLGPDMPIHFLRFHPDYKMMDLPLTPIETLEKHYEIAKSAGLKYVYIGNVPGHPAESTYCPGCSKVLIKRFGYDILRKDLGIRLVTNRDEEAINLEQTLLSCLDIPYLHSFDLARAEDLLDERVPDEADLRVRESLFLQSLARAELIPPVYDLDAGRELRQKGRLFHRRVPSTDDRDPLSPEEETVADGTVGDTLPHQPHLGVELQPLRVGARRDHDRERLHGLARGGHLEGVALE